MKQILCHVAMNCERTELMLELKNIVKQYGSGDNLVTALNGVSITFRENEFVSILGHSGCGKTTMLNIIGGLDHYTSGDLVINGVSTKEYKDRDWDAYRNHSIGFIFQSYNLIPHQSVLSNVELALTISGVSKTERKKRAVEALEKVGLGNQLHKRPNQMSGGQMQRVAIARALINNPDILLADEPTGALDSETSVQIMDLLKEIAKDKLVIMVTHNPELAQNYSTRIVKIKDGVLLSDSDPYTPEKSDVPAKSKKKRVSMSFTTAVSLSLNNLLTKKGRTVLTAFAGSIGIIGIALILSLSSGINRYINQIQEETLSSYPLSVMKENADTSGLMTAFMQTGNEESDEPPSEKIKANTDAYEIFNALNSSAKQINNMKDFKSFIDTDEEIQNKAAALVYSYNVPITIYTEDSAGEIIKSDFAEIYAEALGIDASAGSSSAMMSSMSPLTAIKIWEELLPGNSGEPVSDIVLNQYDLVYGSWPKNYNEVVMVLTQNNEIPDLIAYMIGLKEKEKLPEISAAAMNGEVIEDYGVTEWTYEELLQKEFKLILPCEYYSFNEAEKKYVNLTETESGIDFLYNSDDIGTPIKITGFIRPNEETSSPMIKGFMGYTAALTDYIIDKTNSSEIVKAQLDAKDTDIISGHRFASDDYKGSTDEEKIAGAKEFIKNSTTAQKAEIFRLIAAEPDEKEMNAYIDSTMAGLTRESIEEQMTGAYAEEMGVSPDSVISYISQMDDETLFSYARDGIEKQYKEQYAQAALAQLTSLPDDALAAQLEAAPISDENYILIFDTFTPDEISDSTYEENLSALGYADFEEPSSVRIYVKTFADKDVIADRISYYNDRAAEEDIIHYTDYVALLMSSITDIISGISYLLIAFVGISLVVSSIMIGIITYISVLERTREIGILRAIGASKGDISTVFNAETLLVGLASGVIGIGVSLLAIIPINAIIYSLTGIDGLKAALPAAGAVILIIISMALTLTAGLIPSRVAAKKDPVEALRTE